MKHIIIIQVGSNKWVNDVLSSDMHGHHMLNYVCSWGITNEGCGRGRRPTNVANGQNNDLEYIKNQYGNDNSIVVSLCHIGMDYHKKKRDVGNNQLCVKGDNIIFI